MIVDRRRAKGANELLTSCAELRKAFQPVGQKRHLFWQILGRVGSAKRIRLVPCWSDAQKRGVPQQVVYERLVVCDIFGVATGGIFKRADPESEYASVVFEGGNGLKVGRQQSIGSQLVVFLAVRIGYENGFDMQVAPLPEIRIVEE